MDGLLRRLGDESRGPQKKRLDGRRNGLSDLESSGKDVVTVPAAVDPAQAVLPYRVPFGFARRLLFPEAGSPVFGVVVSSFYSRFFASGLQTLGGPPCAAQ